MVLRKVLKDPDFGFQSPALQVTNEKLQDLHQTELPSHVS